MQTIRTSMFETNSSSSHSITMNAQFSPIDTIFPTDGKIIIDGYFEFQDEGDSWNDPISKIVYFYLDNIDEDFDTGKTLQTEKTKLLIECIKEHTGAKEVEFNFDKNSYADDYGVTGFLNTKEQIINFIFNPECCVTVDIEG